MFEKGQLVVCVKFNGSENRAWLANCAPLVVGAIYTIRLVLPRGLVLLHEIRNPIAGDGLEFSYTPDQFRPIEDIADPEKTKVTEDVPATA